LRCYFINTIIITSVADPDPGSGAFLPQGSGIRDEFFPDPGFRILDSGFRIPNMTEIKFKLLILMNFKVYSIEIPYIGKDEKYLDKVISMKFYYINHLIRQDKVRFFWHLTFLSRIRDPESGIWFRDPEWQERTDPGSGSGINIPDPQH
jgi:hypothetical protein